MILQSCSSSYKSFRIITFACLSRIGIAKPQISNAQSLEIVKLRRFFLAFFVLCWSAKNFKLTKMRPSFVKFNSYWPRKPEVLTIFKCKNRFIVPGVETKLFDKKQTFGNNTYFSGNEICL